MYKLDNRCEVGKQIIKLKKSTYLNSMKMERMKKLSNINDLDCLKNRECS